MTTLRTSADRAGPAIPDRVLYDAIDGAVRLMAAHLDRALAPDAIGADDREAMRALLEDRLEPRVLDLRPARAA